MTVRGDAGPEAVGRIGGGHAARQVLAVEGQGIEPLAVLPEVRFEALSETPRRLPQRGGGLAAPKKLGDFGAPEKRGVLVALRLHHGDGRRGELAGCVHDGVVRVLPPLVRQSHRRAGPVCEVAVAGTWAHDPPEGALEGGPQLEGESAVAGPAHVFRQQHHEERGRVNGSVVRDERDLTAGRHLAGAQLVQDTAGLLVREGVVVGALVPGQEPQRATGDLWLER